MDLATRGNAAFAFRVYLYVRMYVRVYIYIYFLLLRVHFGIRVCVRESETLEIAETRRTKENRGDVREGPG